MKLVDVESNVPRWYGWGGPWSKITYVNLHLHNISIYRDMVTMEPIISDAVVPCEEGRNYMGATCLICNDMATFNIP